MPGNVGSCNALTRVFVIALALLATAGVVRDAPTAVARDVPPQPVVEPVVASGTTVSGEMIVYPTGAPARLVALVVTVPPGAETGWHTHGVPAFGYVLEGELAVEYRGQGERVFRAGDGLFEAMKVPHNGRNRTSRPVRLLALFMGAEGVATTAPERAE